MLRTADIDYSAAVDIIRYTKNRRERWKKEKKERKNNYVYGQQRGKAIA